MCTGCTLVQPDYACGDPKISLEDQLVAAGVGVCYRAYRLPLNAEAMTHAGRTRARGGKWLWSRTFNGKRS